MAADVSLFHCDQAKLCDDCRERDYGWLAGTAGCHGVYWAERVTWRLRGCSQAWPEWGGRVRDIAMRMELQRDTRLTEALARHCYERARERWEELRGDEAELGRLLAGRCP